MSVYRLFSMGGDSKRLSRKHATNHECENLFSWDFIGFLEFYYGVEEFGFIPPPRRGHPWGCALMSAVAHTIHESVIDSDSQKPFMEWLLAQGKFPLLAVWLVSDRRPSVNRVKRCVTSILPVEAFIRQCGQQGVLCLPSAREKSALFLSRHCRLWFLCIKTKKKCVLAENRALPGKFSGDVHGCVWVILLITHKS